MVQVVHKDTLNKRNMIFKIGKMNFSNSVDNRNLDSVRVLLQFSDTVAPILFDISNQLVSRLLSI
jgi:hypothetical protein